jgi:hypothetical protein
MLILANFILPQKTSTENTITHVMIVAGTSLLASMKGPAI